MKWFTGIFFPCMKDHKVFHHGNRHFWWQKCQITQLCETTLIDRHDNTFFTGMKCEEGKKQEDEERSWLFQIGFNLLHLYCRPTWLQNSSAVINLLQEWHCNAFDFVGAMTDGCQPFSQVWCPVWTSPGSLVIYMSKSKYVNSWLEICINRFFFVFTK